MQKITPFLWFNANAKEAVKFYTAIRQVVMNSVNLEIKKLQAAAKGK
jgi:predicted 3-demethylubiquinone-9 3-methyltransferase (glyoxalase superfamily)